MGKKVICVGGPRSGWEGTIIHGRTIRFPGEPKADYTITDNWDDQGRYVAVPSGPATTNT